MNEPIRLSASGSPLAKRLLVAGRRERPRDERKVAAIAAALLLASDQRRIYFWWQASWLRWLLLLGLGVIVGGAACAILGALPFEERGLSTEPLLVDRPSSEPLPFIPKSSAPPLERHVDGPARVDTAPVASPRPLASVARPSAPATRPTELELLRKARIENAKGDSASALASLDDHERLYPTGVLGEEAAALRVEALVRSADATAARAAARHFAKKYPESAYLERVRSIAASGTTPLR